MSQDFFIADLHFFDEGILKTRPGFASMSEMKSYLIAKWNTRVGEKDTVWVLGDFARTKDFDLVADLVESLNGEKVLILGNHDNTDLWQKIKEEGVGNVLDVIPMYSGVFNENLFVLNHYPLLVWPKRGGGAMHLYGHVHNQTFKVENMPWGSCCVSVEMIDYEPKTIPELMGRLIEKNKEKWIFN